MKNSRSFNIMAGISLLFTLFIFGNSLIAGEDSARQSGAVLEFIKVAFSWIELPEETLHLLIRKLAHFGEFMVYGILLVATFSRQNWLGIRAPLILLIGLSVAVTDEFIQSFIPMRGSSVRDIVLDLLGFVVGFIGAMLVFGIASRKKAEK